MDLQEPTAKMSGSMSSDKGLVLLSDDPGADRQEDPLGGHRHRGRGALRPRDQARGVQPARHPLGALGHADRAGRGRVRRAGLRRPQEGRRRGRRRRRHARSASGWPSCSPTPPSSTASSPAAPSARPSSPRPRWRASATRSACCPRRSRVPAHAEPRRRHHRPRALGDDAPAGAGGLRRPDGLGHPAARHAAAADRRRRRRACRPSSTTCGSSPRRPSRSTWCSRAPAPSGRCRRSSSCRCRRASPTARRSSGPCARGRSSAPSTSPTTRTSRWPTTSTRPSLDRAFESLAGFRCGFRVASVELYHHDHDGVWRVVDHFPLGG